MDKSIIEQIPSIFLIAQWVDKMILYLAVNEANGLGLSADTCRMLLDDYKRATEFKVNV